MPTHSPRRPTENNISQVLAGQEATYKLGAVRMLVLSNELDDVPVFHPLGDHRKPAFGHRHPKQWQDIRMLKVLPGHSFSAEALRSVHSWANNTSRRLTLRMTCRSLVM